LQAVALLAAAHPDLNTILRDPRVEADLPMVEFLAALGRHGRTYYARRFGTQARQIVQW
jgi:hypothetical protein